MGGSESLSNNHCSDDPKVSIITPLYNSSAHVSSFVDYIKKQSYENIETIIVVDSKCSDDTLDKITIFSASIENVKIIEQKDDLRSGGARNLGLDIATGEYIWFLDVDDRPHLDFIKEMLGIITRFESDVVVCNHYYSYRNEIIEPPVRDYKMTEMTGYEALEEVVIGRIPIPSWSKLYKRSFITDNELVFSSGYSEDYDYTMRSFMNANKVIYYNKPLYTYVLTKGSRSSGAGDKIVRADVTETMKVAEKLKDNEEKYERFCANSFRHLLHSLTIASRKTFRELSKTDDLRMMSRCKQESFSLEVFIYRLSPTLYYVIGKTARKMKFLKRDLIFDRRI